MFEGQLRRAPCNAKADVAGMIAIYPMAYSPGGS